MARRATKAESVANAIEAGLRDAAPGTWLPTWADLSAEHEVALGTVDSARKILVERGVIELVPNKGARKPLRVVVRRDEADQLNVINGERGFAVAVRAAGLDPWDRPQEQGWVSASAEVAAHLGVPAGADVFRRSRQQGWNELGVDVNVVLSSTWILKGIADEIPQVQGQNTGPGGIHSRFEDAGYRLSLEVVSYARAATDAEAEWLGVPSAAAVHDAWRRCFDQSGRILEVTQRVLSTTKHQLVFRYGQQSAPKVID